MKFYQNKRKVEFKVGLFTIIAIFILVISYLWLTEALQNRGMSQIKLSFQNAGNVEVGSSVTVNGVKRGRVKEIVNTENGVIVDLQVKLDFPLREGTEFYILESNLMGDVNIEIRPSISGEKLDFNKVQSGEKRFGLMSLVSELSTLVSDFQVILNKIATNEGSILQFDSLIDSTLIAVNKVNSNIDKHSREIDRIIYNADQLTTQLNEIISTNKDNLSSTLELSSELIGNINSTSNEIKKTSISIRAISEQLQKEEGSFNKLMTSEQLYDNLIRSSARLDSLLKDIKENPKKYFNIKIL
ncbi:MAG: MlaD family protein [Candidatus Cloacimonetes bacterium]|nr:MlaD family protein [Candidatus Cloacimonadota bacterium]